MRIDKIQREVESSATAVGKEPLQVRLPVAVKRKFKAHAALRGMEPNELFLEMWKYYEQAHQESVPPRSGN